MNQKRTWRNQFPKEFTPPIEIQKMVSKGLLEDRSWGNDVCPSFRYYENEIGMTLWVEQENPQDREMNSLRYTITTEDNTCHIVWSSDNLMETIAFILLNQDSVVKIYRKGNFVHLLKCPENIKIVFVDDDGPGDPTVELLTNDNAEGVTPVFREFEFQLIKKMLED